MPDPAVPGAARRRERLTDALADLKRTTTLPIGRIDHDPVVAEVFASANDLARRSELEPVADEIESTLDRFSVVGQTVVSAVGFRSDDRFILGHNDADLNVMRVDFTGVLADIPELSARIRPTPSGSLIIESTTSADRAQVSLTAVIQLIVDADEATLQAHRDALEQEGLDREQEPFGLQGDFASIFHMGLGVRAAWGAGTVTIGPQNVLGLIFDDALPGPPKPPAYEASFMPSATVASDLSSVIVFAIPRSAIHEVEVLDAGYFASRIPNANIHGESHTLALQTLRVFQNDRQVKPKKHQLSAPLRALPLT